MSATHLSLTYQGDGQTSVIEKHIPALDDDSVMIKVKAVSLNPTDFKHISNNLLKPGASTGMDFAGDIVQVGKNVQTQASFKVGDAVAGFTRGGVHRFDNGAFQEYVVMPADLVWLVDRSVLGYEDAAAMGGIALSTAVYALNHNMGVPYPKKGASLESARDPNGPLILIWSGATAVGMYAIKLAALAGYRVATTASPHNHELVKSLGAEVAFDYKDPEAPSKIREWSNGELQLAFVTTPYSSSGAAVLASLKDAPGSKAYTLIRVGNQVFREGGNVQEVYLFIYEALLPEHADKHAKLVEWDRVLSNDFGLQKELKVAPLQSLPGGLKGIIAGLEELKLGRNSAVKYVVPI